MSSSKPKTAIFLSDSPEIAEKKVKSAKTGGKESLVDQSHLGGVPEECVVYEMLLYHLVNSDSYLKEMYHNCKSGTIMCGECKNKASGMMRKFFEELSQRRIIAEDEARKILSRD
jgi:tryptophanyl-tRNA synthetase